jgi:hypothetical protein
MVSKIPRVGARQFRSGGPKAIVAKRHASQWAFCGVLPLAIVLC